MVSKILKFAFLQSLPTVTSSQIAAPSFYMLFNLLFINHPNILRFEVQLLRASLNKSQIPAAGYV